MKSKCISYLDLITLVLAALVTVIQTLPPSPLLVSAPPNEFSAERAVEHIRIIANQPRPTGSPANAAARDYILAELKGLGLETEIQREDGLVNVVGKIVGTTSSDAVLLTAHLDSVAEGPGATDDGSGVAVLLETARAIVSDGPLPNTVMFLFTDFEEGGTIGAKAFITNHPWMQDVRVVIGFDAGGLSGPAVLSTTSANNGWLIRQLAHADSYLTGSSAINALANSGTDFGQAFKSAGFSGYAFDLYWDRRIHTQEDNIENVDLSSLQHQGYHALSLARHFGNLDRLTDSKEPNEIYFSVLRLFTVTYSSIWAVPLALVVAGVFLGVLIFGLREKVFSWGGMGYGAFVVLVGMIISPLPSILLGNWMPGVPIRFIGRSLDRPLEVSVAVLLALALLILWYFLSIKIKAVSLPELAFGALVPSLAGMIGISIAIPELSFALTWPLLLSLIASAAWIYWHARRKNSQMVILILLFTGVIDILILGPTILLGLFDQASLTLLLFGLLCGFLIPHIQFIWKNNFKMVKN